MTKVMKLFLVILARNSRHESLDLKFPILYNAHKVENVTYGLRYCFNYVIFFIQIANKALNQQSKKASMPEFEPRVFGSFLFC